MFTVRLNTDSSVEMLPIENTNWDYLNKLIGCDWIEIVRPKKSQYVLVVDEEGLLQSKMLNPHASIMYGFMQHHNPIAGPALMLKEQVGDEGPELVGLDEKEATELIRALETVKPSVMHDFEAALLRNIYSL